MGFQHPPFDLFPTHAVIIGDAREEGGGGETVAHIYPGTGAVTREVRLANAGDVDRAVAAARASAPAWRALPGDQRRDLMFRLAALIDQHSAELAALVTAENGMVIMHGPRMAADAAQKFRYFGGWADKIEGRTVATWGGPAHDYVAHEPYGVVGVIVPWNGPLFASTMVTAPALAAGNCIVIKAPDLAPFTVMRLGELVLEAGFPPGVFNVVAGGTEVGAAMVSHPGVDKIEFIGSGATATKILENAARTLKPCGLELGGKSAVIVFADADPEMAVRRGVSGAVAANGQGCVNGTRLLVERSIYDGYVEKLAALAGAMSPGDPFDAQTIYGPVISEQALRRIQGMVQRSVASGGRLVAGGERLGGEHAGGFYLSITVLADVAEDAEVARNEVFGPVLAVTPFDDEAEAIRLANATDYGLGAYIHTSNLGRAHRVAAAMQAGQVQVNGAGEAMTPCVPFGGMKRSGHGRLGGVEGLHEFLQVKNVWMNLQG